LLKKKQENHEIQTMLAVIFKARLNAQLMDTTSAEFKQYVTTAAALREVAINQYQCIEFTSTTEGDKEVALSYWQDIQAINNWKADKLHRQAQQMGRDKWYKEYSVEVVEILKSYNKTKT